MIIKSSDSQYVSQTGNFGRDEDPYNLDLCLTFTPTVLHHHSEIATFSVTCKGSCDRTNCGTATCVGTCE